MAIKRFTWFDWCNYAFLSTLSLVVMYPLLYVLFASLSNGYELMAHEGLLFKPAGFSLAAYEMVSRSPMVLRGFMNSVYLVIVGTTVNIVLTSMGAYALSRNHFLLRGVLTKFCVIPMFISGGLIPFYLQIRALGLYDTLWSVIFAFAISVYLQSLL